MGSLGEWLTQLAHGIDERRVESHRDTKSSGSEHTFAEDLRDGGQMRDEIARMAERAARWLERHALYALTVTIKVRYNDFVTLTRSHTERPATRDAVADHRAGRRAGRSHRSRDAARSACWA